MGRRSFAIHAILLAALLFSLPALSDAAGPPPRRQTSHDVALKGLVWRGHRYQAVSGFATWLAHHGSTYAAWARRHPPLSLGLWQHTACHPHCAAMLGGRRLTSWNPHASCTPILTTIERLIGSRTSPLGGALESGGLFQPHLTGDQKHMTDVPCRNTAGTPSLVEIDGVQITEDDVGFAPDGDRVFGVTDPNRTDLPLPMRSLYLEISSEWQKAQVAPATSIPAVGSRIDIQGFVAWDEDHTDTAWHYFSGWELHPLSAWRNASPTKRLR